MTKTRRTLLKSLLLTAVVLAILVTAGYLVRSVFSKNVDLHGEPSAILLIPTGATFETVKDSLYSHNYIRDRRSFEWTAARKGYHDRVKPGRYRILDGMSNSSLLDLLRSGRQEPVRLFFQNARTPAEFAGIVARQLEADSLDLLNLMRDSEFLRKYGITPLSVFTITLPNTYEFFWNTSARGFVDRMYHESEKFWNAGRMKASDSIGLSREQVVILASIVEKETAMNSEKRTIAGVYVNRLKRHMPLQADPTLIFAWNDYTIKRVLNRHKEIRSPYNTYTHKGLPPGPICLPSVASIDAVLHYDRTHYLYFCAREDFSGYHNFAVTLAEHNRNAARYQKALQKANTVSR
jgi:UPF0755 protein